MRFNSKTLAATLMAGTALAGAALAQGGPPAGPLVPRPPTALNPSAPNPFGGMPKAGMPMGGGHLPFAAGTVSAVDAAAGTVSLTPMFGAAGQTVKVTDATQISAQVEARISDLKVGDTVQVRGVPTGITASQITAGDGADTVLGGPLGGPGKPGGPGMAYAQATGRITGLSPLTVSISEAVSVVLKAAPDVRVVKTVMEKVGDLKVGDRIMANGQSGDDNVLTASRIRVNADSGFGRPAGPNPPRPIAVPMPLPGQSAPPGTP